MTRLLPKRSICLAQETWDRIAVQAKAEGISQSEVARNAIQAYFKMLDGSGANFQRIAELAEFNQLVLDRIARTQFPDLIDPILNAVHDRLVQHHGK
jgi:hypothetical protein